MLPRRKAAVFTDQMDGVYPDMKRFFKRCAALTLTCVMTCSLCVSAFAAGSLDHFKHSNTYENQFSDVSGWYAGYVAEGYELGLFDGSGDGRFSPHASMTVGEAVKIAACLHSIYETGEAGFAQSDPWWQVYADYCLEKGIIESGYSDYSNAITRGQFAMLFAAALPDEALTEMNAITGESIPDVRLSDPYGSAVYKLYRAGVLTGSGADGSFRPNTNISRSEMAAIVIRMVRVTERKSVSLGASESGTLNAEQIYAKCSPSVFSIKTYDEEDEALAVGSGVFLSAAGEAVTNWHVLDGARRAEITTVSGETYPIRGVYDYDAENDLARIQVDGTGFTPMQINYSGAHLTGATIYTIGSPRGLGSSLSAGIISAARREVNGVTYIQVTAPISSGSSGGALINAKGELIGITSASVSNGQNLNLAVPIEKLTALDTSSCRSIPVVAEEYIRKLTASFKLSRTNVNLDAGDSAKIICSVPGIPSGYAVSYESSARSIVQCSWGEWKENDDVELTLTGLKAGTVTVTVKLHDRKDNVLAERNINVRVQ